MEQTRERIFPLTQIDRGVAVDLVRLHPNTLLLLNPLRNVWQVYETYRRSDWPVLRLRQAIIQEYIAAVANDARAPRTYWWNWRGAPVLIADLPKAPGEWTLLWLKERAVPPTEFLRRLETENDAKARADKQRVHDMHHVVAHESRRHLRDALRGDPMAGHRKWSISVGEKTAYAPTGGS